MVPLLRSEYEQGNPALSDQSKHSKNERFNYQSKRYDNGELSPSSKAKID